MARIVLLVEDDSISPGTIVLPFSWNGVRLNEAGASALRVVLTSDGEGSRLTATDRSGSPVLSVGSLVSRPVDATQLQGASGGKDEALFRVDWVALASGSPNGQPRHIATLGDAGALDLERAGIDAETYEDVDALGRAIEAGAAPDLVLSDATTLVPAVPADAPSGVLADTVRDSATRALELVQRWLADSRLSQTKLVLLTCGAVAVRDGESPDLVEGPLWGLVRSAQSEHPDRFGLIDVDGSDVSWQALPAALAAGGGEPQLALREGGVYAPRLQRAAQAEGSTPPVDPQSTVLITGATGALGMLVATHLVERGARHLLLVSRSGPKAEGAGQLEQQLTALGCEVRIEACDVSDRGELAALLDSIPAEHPLGAVIHAAGVLEDATIESLDADKLGRVMRPKIDAAAHLHELTEHLDLSAFVLFSSAAATLGNPGQGNYAAANAFLDALAQHRRAQGLAASSLGWGLWASESSMIRDLGETGLARMARQGFTPLSDEEALALLDRSRELDEPLLVPVRLDLSALRARAREGMLPAILRALVRAAPRRARGGAGSLARRLAGLPEAERDAAILELVRGEVAAVLAHPSPESVGPQRPFKELGFDSLAAVEFRNRLSQASGLRLPSTLVFDHPSPAAAAAYLVAQLTGNGGAAAVIDEEIDKLESLLASVLSENGERERVRTRLQTLAAKLAEDGRGERAADKIARIRSASVDEIFDLIDEEIGSGG